MYPKQFARIGGGILLLVGLFALIPSLSSYSADLPPLNVESSYGMFLNAMPFNIINKIVMIVLGGLGILATLSPTRSLPFSIRWAQVVCLISVVTFILGVIPSTNTLGGYMPLFSGDAVFHAVLAVFAGYFGFALKAKADREISGLTSQRDQFSNRKAG